MAGLSRELDVSPSVMRRWKRRYEQGALTAVESNDDVPPGGCGKPRAGSGSFVHIRFPEEGKAPKPIQFLSDNGGQYTALDTVIRAEELGLVPITTPAASPEPGGMSEAFVNTIKRDYADLADRSSAAALLAQLPIWFDDYNHEAPHSALGMKTPAEYRCEKSLS